MTRRFYRQLLATTSLLALGGTQLVAANPVQWKAGTAVVYEGTATLSQTAGGDTSSSEFTASETVFARERVPTPAGARTNLLVARSVVSKEGGAPTTGAYDELAIMGDIVDMAEAPMEVDEAQHLLGVYVPLRVSIPPGNTAKVSVFGQAFVSIDTERTIAKESNGTRHTLKLASGAKKAFEFRGSPATLVAWKESYLVGDDGALRAKSMSYRFEVELQGTKITAGVSCDLKASSTKSLDDPDVKSALAAFQAAHESLAARVASSQAKPKIDALEKAVAGGPYAALAHAASSRLQGLVATFESDQSGKILAQLLGKRAPNFTLDSLDGKKVDFHEVTTGKPAYLVFWGVG